MVRGAEPIWIHTYLHTVHTNLYSAKNRENESEALAQNDYRRQRQTGRDGILSGV